MITVIGSVNMDAIAHVAHIPRPGETVLARSLDRSPGGKGANQAIAAARAGAAVEFVGRVGSDAYGRELAQNFRDQGVGIRHLIVDDDRPSGLAMITVDDHGENSIVVVPGANGYLEPGDVDSVAGLIGQSSVVLAQLEIRLDVVQRVAEIARDTRALFLLNPAPAIQFDHGLYRLVDVLIPNEEELALLTGLGGGIDAAAAAHLLLDTGVGTVVVTRGPQGAVAASQAFDYEVGGLDVDAVDTTGAGDTFIGNFAYALDAGETIPHAVEFANAAAALSVVRAGAQTAMPAALDTRRLMQEGKLS